MNGYYFNPESVVETSTTYNNVTIWAIVSIVLAIIGGIVIYYIYIKKETPITNKYLSWARDFFAFKKMLLEDLLKIGYLILTIYITLLSFSMIGSSFIGFLIMLILGNLILRIIFEGSLILLMIWKNTNDINRKMTVKEDVVKTTKKKAETKEE